jgi:phosphinothricin acetyltransferase
MIRAAVAADAAAIAAIYAPAVLHGTASFELEPPAAAEMAQRMARVAAQGCPWLVFDAAGGISGYAYAARFHDRAAYALTCETSVYVAPGSQRGGVGRQLLAALAVAAGEYGFREMIAVIGDSDNSASIGLHSACGFAEAGRLRQVGWKFGRWLDVVYMQRSL